MTSATHLISVERGHDPRDFALVAGGGAGPLHAVEIARELRIPQVVVPPTPGVTSALGILQVDLRHDLLAPVLQQVKGLDVKALAKTFERLIAEATEILEAEDIPDDRRSIEMSVDARYYGQTPYMNLKLEASPGNQADVDALVAQYRERYESEFGYQLPEDVATVEIVNARVAAIGLTEDVAPEGGDRGRLGRRRAHRGASGLLRRERGLHGHPDLRPHQARVRSRDHGPRRDRADGHDRARAAGRRRHGGPLQQRRHRRQRQRDGPRGEGPGRRREGRLSMETATAPSAGVSELRNDPITFEVLRNAFRSICNEASALIERVSYAPTITEGHDYSVSILTPDGRLVSHGQRDQAPHMGTFESSVQNLVKEVTEFAPGDAFIYNDPYTGGTHQNDVKIIRPIFWNGELFAFAIALCHWPDVGGPMHGTFNPRATECYAEGLRMPPLKLYEKDEPVKPIWDLVSMNIRVPKERVAEMHAQHRAGVLVEERLLGYVEKFGEQVVLDGFEDTMDHSERRFREWVSRLPDGSYEFTDWGDRDLGKEDEPRSWFTSR